MTRCFLPSKTSTSSIGLHKFSNHFSASHLLLTEDFSEGLHGHNYYVEVELFGETNSDGLIYDFLRLDEIIREILSQWDHYTLIPSQNENINITEVGGNLEIRARKRFYSIPRSEVKLLECQNVTAEYLARSVALQLKEKLLSLKSTKGITELRVDLWETPLYHASFSSQLERF